MSVSKEKHEELAGKWSPIVAECDARDIGESIDVWCEKKGISKWKLYYWKKALKNSASAEHPCKTEMAGQCLDITDALSDSGADPARREDYPKSAYEEKSNRNAVCDTNSSIDENNVKYVIRSCRRHWRERLRSEGIGLSPADLLIRLCFSVYSAQFMQIHATFNRLFSMTT